MEIRSKFLSFLDNFSFFSLVWASLYAIPTSGAATWDRRGRLLSSQTLFSFYPLYCIFRLEGVCDWPSNINNSRSVPKDSNLFCFITSLRIYVQYTFLFIPFSIIFLLLNFHYTFLSLFIFFSNHSLLLQQNVLGNKIKNIPDSPNIFLTNLQTYRIFYTKLMIIKKNNPTTLRDKCESWMVSI